jgi:caffeoyl-CoA O-methyltransferase
MATGLMKGFEALTAPGMETYLQSVGFRPHPVKAQLIKATEDRFPQSHMLTHPIQADFLGLLAQAQGAKKCLEVGVFTGLSGLCVALSIPEDGVIDAFDVSEEFTEVAKEHWRLAGVEGKIRLHLVPGVQGLGELLQAGQAGTYDFAYIDADKPNGVNYYDLCVQLLRPGGMVLIDNALWDGSVADPSSSKRFREEVMRQNETVHRDERVNMCLLPLADGVIVAVKK